jgi:NAD(P)H-hydrate epimerase
MYFSAAEEMKKLDKLAVEFGLEIRQMMEIAGWQMVDLFHELKITKENKVAIVCGRGNNGGDGLSAARHLKNYSYDVSVILMSEDLKPDPMHHLNLVRNMNIPTTVFKKDESKAKETIKSAGIVIDALLGYHLKGNPRGDYAAIINYINSSKKYAIAYDLPSGVDAATGLCRKPCITADATLTLALPKKMLETAEGRKNSGEVFLGDIGIPTIVYDQIEKNSRPDFGKYGLIKLDNYI